MAGLLDLIQQYSGGLLGGQQGNDGLLVRKYGLVGLLGGGAGLLDQRQ